MEDIKYTVESPAHSQSIQQTCKNLTFIEQHPSLKQLLSRMPDEIAASFTEKQLAHLVTAVGARKWGKHSIDLRGTFRLPFIKRRFYYVLLFGRNYRQLSRQERQLSALATAFITSFFILLCSLMGLVLLYLIKSALGIDLIEGYSLGIWGWFKSLWSYG